MERNIFLPFRRIAFAWFCVGTPDVTKISDSESSLFSASCKVRILKIILFYVVGVLLLLFCVPCSSFVGVCMYQSTPASYLTEQLVSAHKNMPTPLQIQYITHDGKGNIPLMRAFWSSSVLSCPDLSASTASNHLRSSALWFGAANSLLGENGKRTGRERR